MKKAAFYTLGCKVNQYETEAMQELFEQAGYTTVDFSQKADVYVINTCTVTHLGDRKSRQMIRRAVKLNPCAVIAVTGCYAQTAPEDIRRIEGVNLILGAKDRDRIVELAEAVGSQDTLCMVSPMSREQPFEELSVHGYQNRTRAYIKVQEGCNQFCTYCIIPYARGPIRSRPSEDVLKEAALLCDNGFSEIILTGIHIASYGADKGQPSLANLIRSVADTPGLRRIRLSSIEPMTLDEDFVEELLQCPKLCPHFHISLQSGCDETLRRMNRRYTTEQFRQITARIRSRFPDAAVTTDIMVGFPGETEEEFARTLDFVREISFADAHIFEYSPRKGTPAAKYPDQVDPAVKKQREQLIAKVCEDSRNAFLDSFIGRELEVLFERAVADGVYEGKTPNYITVRVRSEEELSGQIKAVRLISRTEGVLVP